jgi:hypothetical protein
MSDDSFVEALDELGIKDEVELWSVAGRFVNEKMASTAPSRS